MGVEELKMMKTQIMNCVQGQLSDLQKVDTKQLGEAIDMIKDLSEAVYYCTITEAMQKTDKSQQPPVNNITYYTSRMYPDYRGMERNNGYMYYPGGNSSSNGSSNSSSTSYYTDMMAEGRDPREGRAAIRRRMYMEGKEKHKDSTSQLHELEAYLQQLSNDITEMIRDASPEQRATLHQKMTTLASKIA